MGITDASSPLHNPVQIDMSIHTRHAPLTLLLMLLLCACAAPLRQASPELLPLLPPAALGSAHQSRQIVHAAFGERELSVQCILTVDAGQVSVIGLSALGQRLFALHYDGTTMRVEQSPLLPAELPVQRLLSDLQLTYWPLTAWQSALAGSPWQVSEPLPGTRRLHHRQQLVAEIHMPDDNPWQGRLWLSNFQFGYSLSIDAEPLP